MRKLIVTNIMSLDGYYEGPGNNVMALPMDDAFNSYNVERLRAADTLLLGASTYDMFRGFWPSVVDDPKFSADNREISRLDNAIDKVVISDSLNPEDTEPWQHNTRIIRRMDAHEQIAELKRQDGKEILMFGSCTLWSDLLAHDLVDEIHLMVGHVVLGGGTPIFKGKPDDSLRLLDIRKWDYSDNVVLRYEVRHKNA
jgi:dihydrofolate reductase